MTYASRIIPSINRQGIEELASLIEEAWCADTSAAPSDQWSPELPEHGQCAVTALVVQDVLGGSLRRATVNGDSHYWNETPLGEIDLTRSQFKEPLVIGEVIERDREYVLSNAATSERYLLLKSRLFDGIDNDSDSGNVNVQDNSL